MNTSVITIDPDIQSGLPVFANTRVPVKSLFDYLSSGESVDTYLEDYPYVTREQIDLFFKQLYANITIITNYEADIDRRKFAG